MQHIYKQEYILTQQTYNAFNLDLKAQQINTNLKRIKISSIIQIVVGILYLLVTSTKFLDSPLAFKILAVALVFWGVYGFTKKPKKYQEQLEKALKESYEKGKYGENLFKIKFYQDKISYLVGENKDELYYSDFARFYDEEKYFAIHFVSGDVIIMNPQTDREKIKNIINSYIQTHTDNQ